MEQLKSFLRLCQISLQEINQNKNDSIEVRKRPAESFAFSDGSFDHRSLCVDEPLNSTNVNIKSQIPLKIQK